MGERAYNIADSFDGMTLDWSSALGTEFAAAPSEFVSVFRECSPDEMLRIVREGLTVPQPEMRHPDTRQEMELLDRYRPAHVTERGVSRLGAIYAVPTPETPRLPFRSERFVIEIKVDPAHGFVGDMDFITCLIPFIGVGRNGLEQYRGAFQKYWESIIPLGEFREHYREVETAGGRQWTRKAKAPKRLPRSYFAPEILLMTPRVSQRMIRVVRHEPAVDPYAVDRADRESVWTLD
jgi:hypothetical protein